MRVLVAMSGGVDSSVAAALLRDAGHDVVGVTLRLWGGETDQGCCSVADVDDARWVAERLGIDHHVFNLGDDFDADVVQPYLRAHAEGLTPNPCISCNRHIKFDRLLRRAHALGFEALATGHHARVVTTADGSRRIARGADDAKDQSYVLADLDAERLRSVMLPIGHLPKSDVRARAGELGLRTAAKPDSQEVCFIGSTVGRARFVGRTVPLHPGRVVDRDGNEVGRVDAVEMVTVGQRKGLGLAGGSQRRFALDVDVASATVTVGDAADLTVDRQVLSDLRWVDGSPRTGEVAAQASAHGAAHPARVEGTTLVWAEPRRRVAPGQMVALYDGDTVVGAATAATSATS